MQVRLQKIFIRLMLQICFVWQKMATLIRQFNEWPIHFKTGGYKHLTPLLCDIWTKWIIRNTQNEHELANSLPLLRLRSSFLQIIKNFSLSFCRLVFAWRWPHWSKVGGFSFLDSKRIWIPPFRAFTLNGFCYLLRQLMFVLCVYFVFVLLIIVLSALRLHTIL